MGNSSQDFAYAVLDVQVALGMELGRVEEIMTLLAQALADDPKWATDVIGQPDLWGVQTLTREGATVRLLLKTGPGAQWRVQRELRRRVKQVFDDQGLTASLAGQPAPLTFDGPNGEVLAGGTPAGESADAGTSPDPGLSPDSEALSGPDENRSGRRPVPSGEAAVARDSMEVAAQLEQEEESP